MYIKYLSFIINDIMKELNEGQIYKSFDDGKKSPDRLCFIQVVKKLKPHDLKNHDIFIYKKHINKIKEADIAYLVNVEWNGEIVGTMEVMLQKKNEPVIALKDYGGIIYENNDEIVENLFYEGYLNPDELKPKLLTNE